MAKVLLGTCDEVVATDSVLDWSTSKIGGKPVREISKINSVHFYRKHFLIPRSYLENLVFLWGKYFECLE